MRGNAVMANLILSTSLDGQTHHLGFRQSKNLALSLRGERAREPWHPSIL